MPCVVDGGAFLGCLVGSAQEDPLLGGSHLGAGGGLTLALQPHRQAVQFHAKLPEKRWLSLGEVYTKKLLAVLRAK